jgi:STE24 endopeptidase
MYLYTIVAYALLIWWPVERPFAPWIQSDAATWAVVIGQLLVVSVMATLASRAAVRTFHSDSGGPETAQHLHQRHMLLLRLCSLLTFAVDLMLTRWPDMISGVALFRYVPGLTGIITLTPFLAASVLAIGFTYPIDRTIRQWVTGTAVWQTGQLRQPWSLKAYLEFNVRHQLLAVVVPTTFILCAYDVTETYNDEIVRAVALPWASDLLLGVAAAGVFIVAPWMLKHIWTTRPLPDGPLRQELERTSDRIGLRCRNILIWNSGGMVVNAAVMGVFSRIRYVMLSDGLLESMTTKQVEAVFGHEAGHVRHKHIQFFLLFALASMLVGSGFMEALWRLSRMDDPWIGMGPAAIQAAGLGLIMVIWWIGFGFVSRRFERQADLFGSQCVTPTQDEQCDQPCAVHPSADSSGRPHLLCATAARIFASGLEKVALLNGIGIDEPSWRHSSIASRIAHLHELSGDPNRVEGFLRVVRNIKIALIATCVVGTGVSAFYWYAFIRS